MSVYGFPYPFPVDPADHPGQITGGLYPIAQQAQSTASAVQAVNRYFCAPWMADFSGPLTGIAVSVGTGGTVASSMKVALTRPNLTTMQPTALALASNNAGVSVAGTGVISASFSAPVSVMRGTLYFVVSVFTWDTAAPQITMVASTSHAAAMLLGTGLGTTPANNAQGWRFDGTFSNDIAAIDFGAQTYNAVTGANMPFMQVGT